MNKSCIMAALYLEVAQRRRTPKKFLIIGHERPMSSSKFYVLVYKEVVRVLDRIYTDAGCVEEHLAGFDCPRQYAMRIISDFEKELIEFEL